MCSSLDVVVHTPVLPICTAQNVRSVQRTFENGKTAERETLDRRLGVKERCPTQLLQLATDSKR